MVRLFTWKYWKEMAWFAAQTLRVDLGYHSMILTQLMPEEWLFPNSGNSATEREGRMTNMASYGLPMSIRLWIYVTLPPVFCMLFSVLTREDTKLPSTSTATKLAFYPQAGKMSVWKTVISLGVLVDGSSLSVWVWSRLSP